MASVGLCRGSELDEVYLKVGAAKLWRTGFGS